MHLFKFYDGIVRIEPWQCRFRKHSDNRRQCNARLEQGLLLATDDINEGEEVFACHDRTAKSAARKDRKPTPER